MKILSDIVVYLEVEQRLGQALLLDRTIGLKFGGQMRL